jgi:hypothetical protein
MAAGCTVTTASPEVFSLSLLAAVTVTVAGVDTPGAVKMPSWEIVPAVEDHVIAVPEILFAVTVNCCVAPDGSQIPFGVIEMLGNGSGTGAP